jgi:methionine aminopeptidase
MIFGKTDCEIEFMTALNKAKPGERLSNISHAIQKYVEANGFSIVREYVGPRCRARLT